MVFKRIYHKSFIDYILCNLNNRLANINMQPSHKNKGKSFLLMVILFILGLCYFVFAFSMFNGLWYHKLLCFASTGIFVYLCEQAYFELYEKRISRDFPNTLKKLTHYYNHYQGNVIPAIEETIQRCPKSNRIFLIKIKEALMRPDSARQINELENKLPTIWLKFLCRLIAFAKENGGKNRESNTTANGDVISSNLKRLASITTYINIEQGYNDAELLSMQAFVFFSPFLVIPVTRWYNTNLLVDLNIKDIYGSLQAQSLTAVLLCTSGLGAVFIHWMRKLQN